MLAKEVKLLKQMKNRRVSSVKHRKNQSTESTGKYIEIAKKKLGSKFWLIVSIMAILLSLFSIRIVSSILKAEPTETTIPSENISIDEKKELMAKHLQGNKKNKIKEKKYVEPIIKKHVQLKRPQKYKQPEKTAIKKNSPAQLPELKEEKKTSFSYIQKRKKILMSKFLNFEASIDIITDKPMITIKGVPYKKGNKMLDGFMLGDIIVEKGKRNTIEDLILKSFIVDEKSGKKVREISTRVGDVYSLSFYEDGVKLTKTNSTKSTGIILPGERLSSILIFDKTEEKENYTNYFFTLPNKETLIEAVSNDNIF